MNHPDELLAVFVDGTASLPERAEVEAHLSFCSTCRHEVELARHARQALQELPVLDAPGLDLGQAAAGIWPERPVAASTGSPADSIIESPPDELAAARARTPHRPAPSRPARRRWPVRVAQAAVGVAAVSLAVALVVHAGSHSPNATSPQAATGGAPTGPSKEADAVGARQSYTAASFRRLAGDLVQEIRRAPASSTNLAASPLSPVSSPAFSASFTERATACIDRGTGVVAGTRLYYIQQALFEGTDTYVGAFVSGTGDKRSLIVVAVSVDGCQTLQFIRQAI